MRAGLLTERISLFERQKITSDSGFETTEWVKKTDIHARRIKLKAVVGDGVNANEEFIGNTIIFQVRAYSFIKDEMRIEYQNTMFKIILLDKQRSDNTYLITCSKKNL